MITLYAKDGSTEIIEDAVSVEKSGGLIFLEDSRKELVGCTTGKRIRYIVKVYLEKTGETEKIQ